MANFHEMTDDELIEFKAAQRAIIASARADAAEANKVYNDRVFKQHLDEAYKQCQMAADRDGRDVVAQAKWWLTQENAPDPGHRVQATLILTDKGIL